MTNWKKDTPAIDGRQYLIKYKAFSAPYHLIADCLVIYGSKKDAFYYGDDLLINRTDDKLLGFCEIPEFDL